MPIYRLYKAKGMNWWLSTNSEKWFSGFEHFFEWNKGQFYTNLLPKFTFVKTSLLCVFWIAFVKPCSITMKLPDKTFVKRFVLVLFQVKIQRLVNFAVRYKYTNLPKRGKNFFAIISLSAQVMPSCVFHSARVFLLLFFPPGLRGEEIAKPQIKIWQIFLHFLNICTWNYFMSLAKALKCFRIVPGNTERVTSQPSLHTLIWKHLSTNLTRTYYLEYFIVENINCLTL